MTVYCNRCGVAPAPHALAELRFCPLCREFLERVTEIQSKRKGMTDEQIMDGLRHRYPKRVESED